MKNNLLNKFLSLTLLIMGGAFLNPAWGDDFELYSGELTEGDYVICDGQAAMNATISSSRFGYTAITPSNNIIKTTNTTIIWHIASNGDYWTIYNAGEKKYAASTGAANKAQLLEDGSDDKSLWSVTGTETYEFVNKGNTSNKVNANLRKNGTYGFACYSTNTGKALSLYKKVASIPAHTITAQSNNVSYGTVSLSGSTITATPETGYRVIKGEGGYTVTSGTASVTNNGDNTFSVTPSSDCTIRINFEAIPTHTAHFSVNGTIDNNNDDIVAEGADITFPDDPDDINGKTFVGWVKDQPIEGTTDVKPTFVTSATMSTSDVTYYAVYAEVTEEDSDDPADAEISQTLEYDTWTYSGTTTDKTSYRLFAKDAYIESSEFDLGKLMKVVVYAGTYGTLSNSEKIVTVKAGDTTFGNATLSSKSATTENEVTSDESFSGNGKVQVIAGGGDGENNGIRISKVEIFVKGTTITASNFTTDVRAAAGISFAESEVSVKLTSDYSGQALTNPNSVTVTYSSSDASVATVNSSTGAVTELLKAGTTTITASFAGNATYKPATVSYELTITEKTPHGLSYAISEVEKLTTDAAFTNALTNDNTLTVAYTSSDTNVATVNTSTGEVTIQGAGTATITATFAGDATYEEGEASYTLTVGKATPTLSFALDNAIGRVGEAFAGNDLTNPASLTVSYSSSNTDVATVNASTGAVTIVAAGTTTITASFAGNDTYTSGSASYTLKVLGEPTIVVANDEIAWGETFTVDNSVIEGGAITVTSGNTSIATVEGLVITPVACGKVEITVSTAEDETYKSGSETFTLTITAPEGKTTAPSGSLLLFSESFGNNTGSARDWNDSYSVKSGVSSVYSGVTGYTVTNAKQGKNSTGSTNSGLNQSTSGTDASIIIGPLNVASYNNMTLSYQWKAASTKGTYTTAAYYATSSNGEYTEITGGTGTGATSFVERSYSVPAAAQVSTLYLKIVWNTSNTQGIIDEVQLTAPIEQPTKTLNSSGYATFCSEYPLDFTGYATADYSAWEITAISESEGVYTLTFNQLTGTIKGGQGILLKGTPNATVTVNFAKGTTEFDANENLLVGTLAPTYVEAGEYYGLKGQNFVRVAESTVDAGKALLPASALGGGSVKAFNFVFEDNATGIRTVETVSPEEAAQIFDLSGRRLNKIQKGINIVNGKKVLY